MRYLRFYFRALLISINKLGKTRKLLPLSSVFIYRLYLEKKSLKQFTDKGNLVQKDKSNRWNDGSLILLVDLFVRVHRSIIEKKTE